MIHKHIFESARQQTHNFMFTSDWHFDNPKCNRDLLFSHLDMARERNAKVIINGDLLCLMQGKYDKRGNKSAVLPEHNNDRYLQAVIEDTAKKLMPYKDLILQINTGNHESAVSQRCEIDVLDILIQKMGGGIALGGYMGYIQLQFNYNKNIRSIYVGYDHGHWGGVITKGALSVVRHASIFPNADIVISGHTHDGWIMNHPRFVVDHIGQKTMVRNQWHIKTGTYKEEFEKGTGWATEKIGMPKYLGSCFCEIHYQPQGEIKMNFTLTS